MITAKHALTTLTDEDQAALVAAEKRIDGALAQYEGRPVLVDLARTLCRKCGRTVEPERECYAIPTCFACLPPPPPMTVLPSFAAWQKRQGEVASGACSDCGDPLADPSTADECSIEHGAARGAGESEEP